MSAALQPLVLEVAGEARTTSVIVAEAFEKRHDNVLRTIRGLVDECSDLALTFEEMVRESAIGSGAKRKSDCYSINRKGFMLLVMRFTGSKALKMQIAFIDQFDRMEAALAAPTESIEQVAVGPGPGHGMIARFDQATPDEYEAHRMKLRTVEAARMAFGAAGARKAWKLAGLPDLSEADELRPAGIAIIEALHRSLTDWLTVRTEFVPGYREETQALHTDYVLWAKDEGYSAAEILSLPAFGKALTRCNVASIKTNRMHRVGLRLAA